jgi:hypothetical protein
LFGQCSDKIQPFLAFELVQIPEKLGGRGMAGGIGHSDFPGPFGTQKIVERFRKITRLDHIRIVQNANRQDPPRGDHAVFFLKLGRKFFR